MVRIVISFLAFVFITGSAMADECKDKAIDKNGKPLAGAALTRNLNKCRHDACDAKAVSSTDGKKLVGAAYNSSMKKCMADAAAAP